MATRLPSFLAFLLRVTAAASEAIVAFSLRPVWPVAGADVALVHELSMVVVGLSP